ncbi:hypothetical protein TNIN_466861 [Trichonephila inaurata madagascariensis]|uniref:Uncharacterized protein n=1 Tax=Trichonephila inaurata madagascariensis TaxID=2747483 RepID=A0A8X7CDK4_9ARAC|nr:hypothetical protein TNIN_466861 [Trichonephila inaurata madagascariensis]
MRIIYQRIMLGRDDFNYIHLLKMFWEESPSGFKDYLEGYPVCRVVRFIVNTKLCGPDLRKYLYKSYNKNFMIFQHMRKSYIFFKDELIEEYRISQNSNNHEIDDFNYKERGNQHSYTLYEVENKII